MERATLLALGVILLLPTMTLLAFDISLVTRKLPESLWPVSLASTVFTAVVLVALGALVLVNSLGLLDRVTTRTRRILLACVACICLGEAAASVALAKSASQISDRGQEIIFDKIANNAFVILYSVLLGASFLSQVGLLGLLHIPRLLLRKESMPSVESSSTDSEVQPPVKPAWRVKAVPYASTRPSMADTRGVTSFDSTLASMRRCTSPSPTVESTRSSFSHTTRRPSSKRQLLSLRELQHPLDCEPVQESTDAYVETSQPMDEPPRWFQNLEAPRSLETIPASPVVGETDFGMKLADLSPPPSARQRSRSFSPMGTRLPPPIPDADSPRGSIDEAHIHPLFRSDSPTPPPVATPGTMVVASPDAGRVIHHHPSNQSLRRLRSRSQLAQSSPLSRSSSSETFGAGKPREACGSIREEAEERRGESPHSVESVLRMDSPGGWVGRISDESVDSAALRR
jgi:hypothetical protein